jgi:hypothetical protein
MAPVVAAYQALRGVSFLGPHHCLEGAAAAVRRYRRLIARGKKTPVATTAIARELAAFLWAIAQQVAPRTGV